MAGAEHDVVLAGNGQVGLIGPKCFGTEVHGGPQSVGTQTQQQFHHAGIGIGADVVVLFVDTFGGPRLQAPVLIVDEDAAILHRGFPRHHLVATHVESLLPGGCHVGPPDIGRHPHLPGKFKKAVCRSARGRADYSKGVHTRNPLEGKDFPCAFHAANIKHLLLNESIDEMGLPDGPGNDVRLPIDE